MNRRALSLCSTAIASLSLSGPAQAQSSSEGQPEVVGGGVQDIVVTARRTSESAQTVPVAITAVAQDALDRSQVTNIVDIQRVAPGIVIRNGMVGVSTAAVGIRGQNNLYSALQNDQAVAIYLDNVYIPRMPGALLDFVDLQRTEVLRGPQGTLFGRNTTGGAFNILTNDPVDRLEGRIAGEAGSYGQRNLQAMFNLPVTDRLSTRLVYNLRKTNGYGRNITLNQDIANIDSQSIRGKIKYDSGNFNIILSADYSLVKDRGQIITLTTFDPNYPAFALFGPNAKDILTASLHRRENWWRSYAGGFAAPTASPLFAQTSAETRALYSETPNDRIKGYGTSATMSLDVEGVQIKSITAYRYNKATGLIDSDATSLPFLGTLQGQLSKQYSQEIQVSGEISDRINFIAGGYASRETGYDYTRSQVFGGLIRENFATSKGISKGLFAQAYYKASDEIRFTGGFRYTWDRRAVNIKNKQIAGLPPEFVVATAPTIKFNCNNNNVATAPVAQQAQLAAACSQQQSVNFSYPAWTFGVDWQAADRVLVYAKTSGAARSGGWNTRAGALPAFKPERVKDVEIGFKSDLFDRRVRFNTALFHSWKSGIQTGIQSFVPGIGVTQFIANKGDARIWGAEFELTAAPWEGMEIISSLALSDGKYKRGTYLDTQRVTGFSGALPAGCVQAPGQPATTIDCTVDVGQNGLLQLPKTQFNIGATQTILTGSGALALHLDYAYVSSQRYYTTVPAAAQPAAVQAVMNLQNRLGVMPGYGLFNARIGYTIESPNVEFYGFVRNLTNKKYLASRFADLYKDLGFIVDFPGPRRMWGIGMNWKFGG